MHVHHDGVADTKKREEIWELSVTFTFLLLINVFHVIKYLFNTTLAHPWALASLRTLIYAINLTIDCEFLENHLVLGERASFVREYELDLPELLNQV